jgi:hypothetical protein
VEEAEKAESGLRFWTWSDTSNMSEANARNLVVLLQWRLELNDAELKELVLRLPALLFYDVEKDLLPRLEALQNSRLKLSDAELKQVVMLQPLVLSWSVEKTILPSLAKLRQMKLDDEGIKTLVLRQPKVLRGPPYDFTPAVVEEATPLSFFKKQL